jgi:predicted ATPase/DNA-binding XRE family transcriptional regulator
MATSPPTLFGELLRHHRQAAGLTQLELAERAGLSVHGIHKLERGATHPYRDTAHRLLIALGLTPDEQARFQSAVLAVRRRGTTRHPAADTTSQTNLPVALSSLVGRERDVVEVLQRLEAARLVTLTGVGGCGKTRLAIEVARDAGAHYPDGIWLVDLGPMTDPKLVAHQVGAVFGAGENTEQPIVDALISALRPRQLLLVLDNCEHLLAACATLVDAVLRSCPRVRLLATSREPLAVAGEVVWRVSSLAVPDAGARVTAAEIDAVPSVVLFVERAAAVQPRFRLTDRTAPSVAQICCRLDGIPLALELAAACVDVLSVEHLSSRLDQRFRVLTGGSRAALPRQQTLAAALDWSYSLLDGRERRLFQRLAVFAGGWTLAAAESICVGRGLTLEHVFELLARLARKSLVIVDETDDGAERYRLLETVREYARQKLGARGVAEVSMLRTQHARFYTAFAERLDPLDDRTTGQSSRADESIPPLLAEQGNIRAALTWWLESERFSDGFQLATALYHLWMSRGPYTEGRGWFQALLEAAGSSGGSVPPDLPKPLLAGAFHRAATLSSAEGNYRQSLLWLTPAADLFLELGDESMLADTLSKQGLNAWQLGDAERAAALVEEGRRAMAAVAEQSDRARIWMCSAWRNEGLVARSRGAYDIATRCFQASIEVVRSMDAARGYALARGLSHLGRTAYLRGDRDQATRYLGEALEVIDVEQLRGHVLADCLDWLAAVQLTAGWPVEAARLFGAAAARWQASGAIRYAPERARYAQEVAEVRARLDATAFAAAWSDGESMSPEQAIACAAELRVTITSAVDRC